MARYSVGIYWDNVTLRACLVRMGAAEHTVERIITVRREYDETYSPKRPLSEELSELLKNAFTEPMDTFVTGIPERETMHRLLLRPFGDCKKISLTIVPEVETLLPVSDGSIIVDYVLLGRDEAGLHRIETVSARHRTVHKVVAEMNAAGIDPEIVDSPQAALLAGARGVFKLREDVTYLFYHMGWQETSLAVLQGREVRHIGAFPYGFERIALALFGSTALPAAQLDENLRQGVVAGPLLDACIRDVLIELSGAGAPEGDHVLVPTGYAGFIRDLPERFRQAAEISTDFPGMGGFQREVEPSEVLESFMPVSLALRGIDSADGVNFLKNDLAYTKKIEWIKGYAGAWPKVAAALVLLWLVGLGLNIGLNAWTDRELTARIKKEFTSVMPNGTPMVDPVKQMEQQLGRVSPKGGTGPTGGTPLGILKDISTGIPASIDVLVDSVIIDESAITIAGTTSSYDNVEKIKAGLSSLPYVGEVKIVSAEVDKTDQRIRLKLACSKKSSST